MPKPSASTSARKDLRSPRAKYYPKVCISATVTTG